MQVRARGRNALQRGEHLREGEGGSCLIRVARARCERGRQPELGPLAGLKELEHKSELGRRTRAEHADHIGVTQGLAKVDLVRRVAVGH